MIGWLDPSIDTTNGGDHIIAEAVNEELVRLGVHTPIRLSTRRVWSREEHHAASECDLFVVGGTNLLTSHPLRYRQWHVGAREFHRLRGRVILFGVGWWQYQRRPDLFARSLLHLLLHPDALHSVRDTYAVSQLESVRRRFVYTTCPTLWHVPTVGRARHRFRGTVIATVTDYLRDPPRDLLLLERLRERADRLLIWPQGNEDREYIGMLGFAGHCIDGGLASFDRALMDPDVEYVGTRLHAGIRALNHGVPAVIIAIDNRAREIAANTNLWTVGRTGVTDLDEHLDGFDRWSLELPRTEISIWRREFSSLIGNVYP